MINQKAEFPVEKRGKMSFFQGGEKCLLHLHCKLVTGSRNGLGKSIPTYHTSLLPAENTSIDAGHLINNMIGQCNLQMGLGFYTGWWKC